MVALQVPGLVLEFELLPAMTERPEWGAEITALLHRHLRAASESSGLKCALRVTPTDIRDQGKPPLLRSGPAWEKVKRTCELCRDAGADILSIESVGGKEVHDQALMYGNIPGNRFCPGRAGPARHGLAVGQHLRHLCAGARSHRRARRRHGLRLRQHGHATCPPEDAPRGPRSRRPGNERGPQPGRFRARRRRSLEGLRL